jgi:hypothetical protein
MLRFHSPLIEPDVQISRIRLSDGGIRGGQHTASMEPMPSLVLEFVPQRPDLLLEVIDNMVTLQTLVTSRTLPKSGPFPPPELPGFIGTMSLSDSPGGPVGPSRASGWCTHHRLGSPVLRPISLYRHAVATTPVRPQEGSSRSPETCDSGLPHALAGSAPTSWISRPAQRSLTLRPACSLSPHGTLFHRRPRQYCYLHCRSDCYRLERPLPGGNCTH